MTNFWKRRIPFLLILVVLGMAALFISRSRGRNSPPIPASGGEFFQNILTISTPVYWQDDTRWRDDKIGGSNERIGDVGCTLCCLAMALDHFGVAFTPNELNTALKSASGYTWRGLIKWDAITKITSGKVTVDVVSNPSHRILDAALRNNQLILAKVKLNTAIYHWVLVAGKEGTNYMIRDPLSDGEKPELLTKFESDILGVRIVRSTDTKTNPP